MALRWPARTKAVTSTSGTGPFFLTESPQSGYRTFSQATTDNDLADSDSVAIIIIDTTVANGPNLLQIATAQWDNTAKSLTVLQTYQPGEVPPFWGSNAKDVVVIDNPVLFALLAGGVFTGLLSILITGSHIVQSAETFLLLQRSGATNHNVAASLVSGTSGTSSLNLGDNADEDAGAIKYNNLTNTMTFRTNGVDGPRIDSNGTMKDPSDIPFTPLPGGGVTKVPFYQASAPPGWTKDTSQNDKALRVVSGVTGGSSGGSRVLSSAKVGATSITESQMPTHTHPPFGSDLGYESLTASGGGTVALGSGGQVWNARAETGAAGGGAAHDHDLLLAYIDVIVCSKN